MTTPSTLPGHSIYMTCFLVLLTASFSGSADLPENIVPIVQIGGKQKNLPSPLEASATMQWPVPLTKNASLLTQVLESTGKREPRPAPLKDDFKLEKILQGRRTSDWEDDFQGEEGEHHERGKMTLPRRMLSPNRKAEGIEERILVVSAEGNPNHFGTVQAAVDAVPMWNNCAWIIYIKPGTYYGTVVVPQGKDYIMFLGEEHQRTILTYKRKASDEEGIGILDSATVIIKGSHFVASNIIFENSSPKPDELDFESQTPAIRVSGDKCEFYRCTFLGWQDTLYADQGYHYYKDCRVEGNVDFILGYARALFENCTIYSRSEGFIAAQSKWCASNCVADYSAFVFLRCNLTGTGPTFLGRPWREYAKVLYINTWMGPHIVPQGWKDWIIDSQSMPLFNHTNVYFAESNSEGPGANPDARVKWSRQLRRMQAKYRLRFAERFFGTPKWPQQPLSLAELRKSYEKRG